jgi:hypothetical protein
VIKVTVTMLVPDEEAQTYGAAGLEQAYKNNLVDLDDLIGCCDEEDFSITFEEEEENK